MLHRLSLYVTHRNVVSGYGVKSHRTHACGTFLGFYTGRIVPLEDLTSDDETIGFEITGTSCAVVRCDRSDVIGFVNEPPAGKRANVVAVPLHLDRGNAVGYFAARTIRKHTELWVHYGALARRGYEVGVAAEAPKHIECVHDVLGADVLACRHRYCAPRSKK